MVMILCSLLFAGTDVAGPGREFYFVRDGSLMRHAASGAVTTFVRNAANPSISPSGKRIAFWRGRDLRIVDVATKVETLVDRNALGDSRKSDSRFYPTWTSDSQNLIVSRCDAVKVNFPGKPRESFQYALESPLRLWSIYRYVARSSQRHGADQAVALSHRQPLLGPGTSGVGSFSLTSSCAASVSPGGSQVAFCRNGDLWIADFEHKSLDPDLRGWAEERVSSSGTQEGGTGASNETTMIFRIAWSPSGSLLAVSSDRYGGSGSARIAVYRLQKPGAYFKASEVTGFVGRGAVFSGEDEIVYEAAYDQPPKLLVHSLTTNKSLVILESAAQAAVPWR